MTWWKRKKKEQPTIAFIQGSLQPSGLTDILLREMRGLIPRRDISLETIDVRNRDIDFYYTKKNAEPSEATKMMHMTLERAALLVIAMPVYSAGTGGAVRDFVESTQLMLKGKHVAILCTGRGDALYPASTQLVKLLTSVDAKIIRPVLRASPESFRNEALFDEQIQAVLVELVDAMMRTMPANS